MLPSELKDIRLKLHLSQTQLGSLLGVNYKTIMRWETGESPISSVAEIAIQCMADHRSPD